LVKPDCLRPCPSVTATLMVPSLCLWQASVLRPPTQLADFCENLYYLGDKFCAPCCYHVTYVHQRPMFVFGHGAAVSSMPQALQCGMPRFVFIFLLHSRWDLCWQDVVWLANDNNTAYA